MEIRTETQTMDVLKYMKTHKGITSKQAIDKFGITTDEVVCFGDQQNDMEMLELFELSYAMEHAKSDVKKSATYTTCSVEKTLREMLEQES